MTTNNAVPMILGASPVDVAMTWSPPLHVEWVTVSTLRGIEQARRGEGDLLGDADLTEHDE